MWKMVAVGLAFGCLALTDMSLHHAIYSSVSNYIVRGIVV